MQISPQSSKSPTASFAGRSVLVLLFLFSLLAAVALLIPLPGLKHSLIWLKWMDFCHFPVFFSWQILLASALQHKGQRYPLLKSLVVLVTIAALVEWLQGFFGRSTSMRDWLMGSAAALTGLVAQLLWWRGKWLRAGAVCLVALMSGMAATPPLITSWIMWQDRQAFPQLLTLKSDKLPALWGRIPNRSESTATLSVAPCDLRPCLAVFTWPNSYSGVRRYLDSSDWSGYQELVIELQSAEPRTFFIRIDDQRPAPAYQERFNYEWRFPGGQQILRLPLQGPNGIGNAIDLEDVRKLALFIGPAPAAVSFRILDVSLK